MIKAIDLKIGNVVSYNGLHANVWSVNSPSPSNGKFNNKYTIELDLYGLVDVLEEEIKGVQMQ